MKTTRIEKAITKIGIISLAALAAIGILASLIEACGMDLDKEQYDKIREIALREAMTIKDLTNIMFQFAIDHYEKRHGKVIPRTESPTMKSFLKNNSRQSLAAVNA